MLAKYSLSPNAGSYYSLVVVGVNNDLVNVMVNRIKMTVLSKLILNNYGK